MDEMIFFNNRSDFLFARPSFLGGMARILDLGGTLNIYNESKSEAEADFRALTQDWKAVGDHLRAAYEEYQQSHARQKEKTPPATNQKDE